MNGDVHPRGTASVAAVSQTGLFLHCAIFLSERRIVSDDTFRLVSFEGQESIGEPFEYQLELHGNTQNGGQHLHFDDIIGRPVTVGIAYPRHHKQQPPVSFQRAIHGADAGDSLALFNGIAAAFSMGDQGVYRLTMRPRLHLLSLTNQYRIYTQCNVRDAIGQVLDAHRIQYNMDGVAGDHNPAVARIQDWLQAGETDLDFIRRLMGKSHLYYYVVHAGNSHKLIFANRPYYRPVFPDGRRLRYTLTDVDALGLLQPDTITQYNYQRSLTSSAVQGVFTRQDPAWEGDIVPQFASFRAASAETPGALPFRQYKIYGYGGSVEEIRHNTDATSASMDSAAAVFAGASSCAHFRAGHHFAITGKVMHRQSPSPVRPDFEGRSFVLTQVKHQANLDGSYHNEFQSTGADGFVAPFSMQETQQGVLLARVVAKENPPTAQNPLHYTPAYFDPQGSTLIDRINQPPEQAATGVFVRFSTEPEDAPPVWVKLSASMQTVPELGVTVMVSRTQDESELPEIQNIVQANGSMVVTPSRWTANTHVGSSYSTAYGDGKSIRFGRYSEADLAAAVAIVEHAFGGGAYRETSYSQGAGYSFSCADSQAATAASNATELYGAKGQPVADVLNASESFGSTYNRQYATETASYSNVGASRSTSVLGTSHNDATVNGESVSHTTHNGKITSVTTINADVSNQTTQTGNSDSRNTNNGDVVSYSEVTGSADNTAIHHGTTTSDTTHHANVTSTTVINGNSTNTSTTTGIATSNSRVGVANNNDAVGRSNRNSVTGASVNFSINGVTTDTSATVATAHVSAVGASASASVRGPMLDVSYTSSVTRVSVDSVHNSVSLANTAIAVTTPAGTIHRKLSELSLIDAIKMIM